MSHWSEKYINIPYKLFGTDPKTGMDCFNLLHHIYKKELDLDIPYISSDYLKIVDDAWFQKTHDQVFLRASKNGDWDQINELKPFDLILMSIGATNVVNHIAMYVEKNNIIQMIENRNSAVYKYHRYYQQYTVGKYRWKNLNI